MNITTVSTFETARAINPPPHTDTFRGIFSASNLQRSFQAHQNSTDSFSNCVQKNSFLAALRCGVSLQSCHQKFVLQLRHLCNLIFRGRFVRRICLLVVVVLLLGVFVLIAGHTRAFGCFRHNDRDKQSIEEKKYEDNTTIRYSTIKHMQNESKLSEATKSSHDTRLQHDCCNETNKHQESAQRRNLSSTPHSLGKLHLLHSALQILKEILSGQPKLMVPPLDHKTAFLSEICSEYERDSTYFRPRVTQVWRPLLKYNDDDVTLVTQMSLDRLAVFHRLLEHWDGPVSVAFYINQEDWSNIIQILTEKFPLVTKRANVDIHLVYKVGVYYPVNILRNIALDNAATDVCFLTDADFVPNHGIHTSLKDYASELHRGKRVYVIPAFEFLEDVSTFYPRSKQELIQHWLKEVDGYNSIQPMDWNFFPKSHRPMNFYLWRFTSEMYQVQYQEHFEPYILVNRTQVPRYDEGFLGRIQDKVSHLYLVAACGFEFYVLPDVFTIHYHHENSKQPTYLKCGWRHWLRFKQKINNLINLNRLTCN